ncbi:Pre-mRNA splicing factor PRP21 like protein-domain-containing protein [Mucor lusitanicus]|uniref:Pre-mRNA splicing factor PRP21 like protein-domain-containing protein n=1 Tax=Mucor circinelloides f. lusitanicus TaxID=29924 RepID=A0A8H4BQN2_MUCCL|nr:Pre-mRNA splicing factor PRP21 like protein-domain-containing protein [Mucor lusitanicus]
MSAMEIDQHAPNGTPSTDEPVVTGIIYPPPDIRKMIDKAAANLATKGPELENHIRETNKDGRFNFLNPNDPYYAYYRFKYQEVKDGKAPQANANAQDRVQEPVKLQPVSLAPKEPEPFEFSATMPSISAQDLDIMKLTAQFAARNGRAFISQLGQRESRNYQFDFLRPSHSLFPYFTELVKQYTKVFLPPRDLQEKLQANKDNKYHILERVKERVEWVAWQEAEKKKKNDEDEKERLAYASIDWHDFVVVETVEFTDADEQAELPPPMSLSELENMSLAQKRLAAMPTEALSQQQTPAEPEDVDMDESDDETSGQPAASTAATLPKLPDTSAPIKIRTDYKPKLYGTTPSKGAVPTELCPRCGEAIPVAEMAEHMRIELLDPKWKEQKMAMEAKQRDSNLLQEGNDVAKILKNISGLRPDIFGSDEVDANKRIREQEEEAKRKDRVIWDGHTATMGLANQRAQKTSIEDQIANMHKKVAGDINIGPQIPGQQQQQQPEYTPLPPPTAFSAPQYYTPDQQQAFANQVPGGMYNNALPLHPPPPPPVMMPQPPITPAVRKLDESDAGAEKKPRLEEPEWQAPPDPSFSVTIQTPTMPDKPEWNLNGGTISVPGLLPNTLISTVKDRIASQLGMPAGKQKLSNANTVLNNSKTLSFYGIGEGHSLVLEVRKR